MDYMVLNLSAGSIAISAMLCRRRLMTTFVDCISMNTHDDDIYEISAVGRFLNDGQDGMMKNQGFLDPFILKMVT
jgi:hypothetical protein